MRLPAEDRRAARKVLILLIMSMPDARRIVQQHMTDIRHLFAEPLAARVGRPAADVRNDGIKAGDFKSGESVELALSDGSSMSFRHAFAVFDFDQRIVGVFTEHCGYHCFGMTDLRVEELRDDVVVGQHSW